MIFRDDQLINSLELDQLNRDYFDLLLSKKINSSQIEPLRIFEEGKKEAQIQEHQKVQEEAYPTAIIPTSLLKELPYVQYNDLKKSAESYGQIAKDASIWHRPMQAGTGSSIERKKYLERRAKKETFPTPIHIGSKGTDLFVTVELRGEKRELSLAEIQILRAITEAENGLFKEIIFHDIISAETYQAINAIWNKKCPLNPAQSYRDYLTKREHGSCSLFGPTFQSHLPTIDEENNLSKNRMAPGGHALFGIAAIRAALIKEERPHSQGALVGVIGNGEDLGSIPDPIMVGYIIKNRIPIVMVTTEKTSIDLKGGQIALVKKANGTHYATIIEKAQADQSKQTKLFEQLGLRPNDKMAFFNTNMAIFNYQILEEKLKKIEERIGRESLLNAMAPNLIENWKEQIDLDGIKRKYLQLEGAMGSVLLNLDKVSREVLGDPLVHFINVEKEHRTDFFNPIKTAFDFFMQFYSDRFTFDPLSFRLKNLRAGVLPEINLPHNYYKEVDHLLNSFAGSSILNLESLDIEGVVLLPQFRLEGHIKIVNQSQRELNLSDKSFRDFFPDLRIKNKFIKIDIDNKITVQPFHYS